VHIEQFVGCKRGSILNGHITHSTRDCFGFFDKISKEFIRQPVELPWQLVASFRLKNEVISGEVSRHNHLGRLFSEICVSGRDEGADFQTQLTSKW
jgi:predicted alpha/beta-hydrolase family hydrolase